MAHETSRSYRPADPRTRDSAPTERAPGNDPLAELARLIGQSDPFSDFAGKSQQPQGAHPPEAPTREEPRHYFEPHLVEPDPADWRAPMPQEVRLSPRPLQSIFPDVVSDPRERLPDDSPYLKQRPLPEDAQYFDYEPQEPPYAAARTVPEEELYEPYPEDDAARDTEEEPAPARRRSGIVTVLAVVGLAVVGTAAAFGYRAVFGNSGPSGPPPVIRADTAPAKIVPAAQASETQSSKLIYDRVGDRNQNERIVTREEQPVTIRNPGTASAPRVIFPSTAAPPISPPPTAVVPAPAGNVGQASANPGLGSTEPKKIRTVTIRPDQPSAAPDVATQAAVPLPPPEPTRSLSRTASTPPPAADPVTTAPRAVAPSANSPLSLAPGTRTASLPPRAASNGGSYSVQVSSQRSEADAQASFRSLQTQFPNELGGQQVTIRRADLGDRGTFYRALVGPFGSSREANELCNNLKAAGGQCIVQRN